jgi:hypothetical protein
MKTHDSDPVGIGIRITANKERFGISNDEILSRKKSLQNWKKQMDAIRSDLSGSKLIFQYHFTTV